MRSKVSSGKAGGILEIGREAGRLMDTELDKDRIKLNMKRLLTEAQALEIV